MTLDSFMTAALMAIIVVVSVLFVVTPSGRPETARAACAGLGGVSVQYRDEVTCRNGSVFVPVYSGLPERRTWAETR